MLAYTSSNFINDYIICFNKNNNGTCLMQLSRVYAVTRRITLKLYITLYSKLLNPTLHISPPSSVGSALDLKSKCRSFEPAVDHCFSSNNVCLLASMSLQVKTNSQNDWSVTNQIGNTGLRQDFLSLVYLQVVLS